MAVGFYNNWENVLDKIENLMRSEFGNGLKIYRVLSDDIKDIQYLRLYPVSSDHVNYMFTSETREYGINLELHYKNNNIQKREIDQVMRYISRMEAVVEGNASMELSDGTDAYNCRIEDTEINTDDTDEYIVTLGFKCIHANDITSDTTAPTVTITATEVADGATSYHSTLALTFTMSENTTSFVAGDVTVGNGSIGTLSGSGASYTATLTPSGAGAVTVDVAAGAFTDNAGNDNTAATQFNWTYQINANSIHFEGDNELVAVTHDSSINFTTKLTFSAWIKPDTGVTTALVGGKSAAAPNYGFYLYSRFLISSNGSDEIYTESVASTPGAWEHRVGVYDGDENRLELWVNGVNVSGTLTIPGGGGTITSSIKTNTEAFKIGVAGISMSNFFDGIIDEVALWDTALSGDDIVKIYNSGTPTDLTNATAYDSDKSSDLAGYWKFSEGTGTTTYDETSNDNDGTLINSPPWSTTVPS